MSSLAEAVRITVNGIEREIAAESTLDALLSELQLRRDLIAVEINRQLVRRSEHATRALRAGDQVEIVEFVGGG